MPDLAYLNGEIMPIEKAMVPIEDRGYQFGDGVYEFVASYEGRLFMLEAHLDQLHLMSDALMSHETIDGDPIDLVLRRLLEKGHKVAICEQMQDPRLVKGIVERAVQLLDGEYDLLQPHPVLPQLLRLLRIIPHIRLFEFADYFLEFFLACCKVKDTP